MVAFLLCMYPIVLLHCIVSSPQSFGVREGHTELMCVVADFEVFD